MLDEPRVVADLLELADSYEAKARQLRLAAAIVQGGVDEPSTPVPSAADDTNTTGRAPQLNRNPTVPTDAYLDVLMTDADGTWDADRLAAGVRSLHDIPVKKEAARTMLYRFEQRDIVERAVSRGTWRLTEAFKNEQRSQASTALQVVGG